jgi:hypothetical protein
MRKLKIEMRTGAFLSSDKVHLCVRSAPEDAHLLPPSLWTVQACGAISNFVGYLIIYFRILVRISLEMIIRI